MMLISMLLHTLMAYVFSGSDLKLRKGLFLARPSLSKQHGDGMGWSRLVGRYGEEHLERCSLNKKYKLILIFKNKIKSRADHVSVNCGSTGTFAARNGREWVGDVINPKYSSLLQVKGSSTTSSVKKKLISADPVPYKTARVSRSQFSYSFQVSPGQKTLRLHFNPSSYKGLKGLKDLFTVEAGAFTLLGNFSATLTANVLGVSSFSKEFCLNIQEHQQLNITFSPEHNIDTYAFVNGIEIVSVPAGLSYFHSGDIIGVQVVGESSPVFVDHRTALELIVRRLNVKHASSGDYWKDGTWKIAVDVGFRYMIRLNFSEIGLKIAGAGDVVFKVLINGVIAQTNIDLVKERDTPRYRDYMVTMGGQRKEGKRDLSISMRLYDDIIDEQRFLFGFEIFKMSNPDNNLASPNPENSLVARLPPPQGSPISKTIPVWLSVLGHGNVVSTVAITMVSMICVVVHMCWIIWGANSSEEENKPSARAERLCRRFSLVEIQLATRNFNDGLLIGRGGFGKVYKGLIDRGRTTVAVKRLKQYSMQGKHEFLMEIETLSELRHVNLVSLIGYCNEHREMILVYDYMSGGTLSDHLYRFQRESNNSSSLTWKQRLNICLGAVRGLDYLHTGHGVIHRDVKTSNILLDENFVAKVSDFGLAKHEDRRKLLLQSYISTRVKGTKGYLDPHYLHTGKLTRKTDTYAFGVVLFEILCGRPAVDLSVAEDEHILTIWVRHKINEGEVDQIVASSLREEMSPASLNTFVGISERCLRDDPKNRPTMSQVVQQLELALEQHDNKQVHSVSNERTSASDDIRPRILVFEVLANLIPDTCVRTKCLKKLDDCATSTFLEFENAVASNVSANALPDGGVHFLTRYVMKYIKTLMDYSKTINEDLKEHDSEDPISASPDMVPLSEDGNVSGSPSGSLISKNFRSLLSTLEHNLERKSNSYKDESLRYLFLMNNVHYMAEKVENSELRTVLGDEWIRKHNFKCWQYAIYYGRETWSSMLNFLRDEGIQKPGSIFVSKTLLKGKLQSFYLAFEEVYKNQTGWSIPDVQLRNDLRISTSLNVIQAYRTFVGRHASHHTRKKHIKYTGDDLEDYLFDLFEGSQKSLRGGNRK